MSKPRTGRTGEAGGRSDVVAGFNAFVEQAPQTRRTAGSLSDEEHGFPYDLAAADALVPKRFGGERRAELGDAVYIAATTTWTSLCDELRTTPLDPYLAERAEMKAASDRFHRPKVVRTTGPRSRRPR